MATSQLVPAPAQIHQWLLTTFNVHTSLSLLPKTNVQSWLKIIVDCSMIDNCEDIHQPLMITQN
jgi:hypothetical protein